jgi:SAM-dependent methyltransferase
MMENLSERKHMPNEIGPEVYPAVRVDLGCGKKKEPGFVGIDRFPLPGVDIVADMNKGLPLADNSADYLVASHSLEHVDDLIFTMQEIYRVCKHKALVCIVAPYYHTSANMANPFHKQAFNEHTPRFFTTSDWTPVNKLDYQSPGVPEWGLAESDNSKSTIDFRCLRMELFNFPQYRQLDENEKRRLRQSLLNVVDTIMYHFLVVKEAVPEEELEHIANTIKYQEPTFYTLRRQQEKLESTNILQRPYEGAKGYIGMYGIKRFLRRAPVFAFSLLRRKVTNLKSKG